ncbi:MAG: hypothetical protein ACLTDR_08385 [Adlercreutzia equolifaciens]
MPCGRAFNPATGTVFDGRKLPVADWTEFLLEVFSYGSLMGAACQAAGRPPRRRTGLRQAARGAGGGMEGAVPRPGGDRRDDASLPLWHRSRGCPTAPRPRRLLRGEHCIGIGWRRSGRRCSPHEGRSAMTSGARALAASPGPCGAARRLFTTWRTATTACVRELGLRSERHNSKLISACPTRENPLAAVNRLCHLLRLFLDSHTGSTAPRLWRLPRLFCDDEPSPRQDGKGGVRVGSGNAQPENRPIQGLLREVAQFRR